MTEFMWVIFESAFWLARKMKVVIVVAFRCGDNLRHWVRSSSTDLRTIVFRILDGTTFEGVIEASPYPTLISITRRRKRQSITLSARNERKAWS